MMVINLHDFLSQTTIPVTNTRPTQAPVSELRDQADQVKLQLSLKKSCMLHVNFLKKKSIDEYAPLQTKKSVKILDITLSDDLTFGDHIKQITAKAAGLLKSFTNLRRFKMTGKLLLSCYKPYVIQIVMYGCPVGHPSLTEKHRCQLETIQTRAYKIILGSN